MAALILWTIVALLIALFIGLVIIAIYTKKWPAPDYRNLFNIGIIWLAIGLPLKNPALFIMGLVFMIMGITNKNKWQKPKSWDKLSDKERKIKLLIITILGILVLLGLIFFAGFRYLRG